MINPTKFQNVLLKELLEAGFSVGYKAYYHTYEEIIKYGEFQREELIRVMGYSNWHSLVQHAKFKEGEREFVRILGFGYMLTDYIISGIDLKNKNRIVVNELGALANFIVAIYDHFLDNQLITETNPIRKLIGSITSSSSVFLEAVSEDNNTIEVQIFIKLITYYFHLLKLIEKPDQRNVIAKTLKKAILKMHHANDKLLFNSYSNVPIQLLFQKSILPFVIMGLPAWILCESFTEKNYLRHLRWMYQFGEFIALLDDATDMVEDMERGEPNLIIEAMKDIQNDDTTLIKLAKKIALMGQYVKEKQDRVILRKEDSITKDVNIFSVCVMSWVGEEYVLD